MDLDLSTMGILVKDSQGNLQEQNLAEAFGAAESMTHDIRHMTPDKQQESGVISHESDVSKLKDFRQQLSKVTGETGYQIPRSPKPVVVAQKPVVVQTIADPLLMTQKEQMVGHPGGEVAYGDRTDRIHVDSIVPPLAGLQNDKNIQSPAPVIPLIPKPVHQLTGPVQELGSLTVADLRRWGTVEEITSHLLRGVGLLSRDSLTVKAAGIRAWQKSPVYQLYVEIGRQSMAEGKPLQEVIANRQKNNQPFLSLAEFEAIMEANEQMRY